MLGMVLFAIIALWALGCARPRVVAVLPKEEVYSEPCPDDGIHVRVNGHCVDTNGK